MWHVRNMNHKTKAEKIYEQLRKDIVNGIYRPRQRLIISGVAERFGASEIPVREAMLRLQSDGLVKSIPYVGTVVAEIDLKDMERIYAIRIQLEGLAVRTAIHNITRKHLDLMEKKIKDIANAIEKRQHEKVSRFNRDFHEIVFSCCDNNYLRKIIFDLWALCFRNDAIFTNMPGVSIRSNNEHRLILGALKKRDGALAEELMVRHLERFSEYLPDYLKKEWTETKQDSSRA